MNTYLLRLNPLKALYDKIEAICLKHVAISYFDCGDFKREFDSDSMTFPAVYLETIDSIDETRNTESYLIALNILDRQVTDGTRHDMIMNHDKLKQIFSEIKTYLEQKKEFGLENIGEASITIFPDSEDAANLSRLRGEFTLTVKSLVTPTIDFASIFPENE